MDAAHRITWPRTPRRPRDEPGMSVPVERVRVRAPARLHFGVLDLRGMLGRRFGGMGAAVPAPALATRGRALGGLHRIRARCRAGAWLRPTVRRGGWASRRGAHPYYASHARAQRTRLGHPAGPGGGARHGRAVRPTARRRHPGASGQSRRPVRRRNLALRPGWICPGGRSPGRRRPGAAAHPAPDARVMALRRGGAGHQPRIERGGRGGGLSHPATAAGA